MSKLCNRCSHWQEEHVDSTACEAPGCDCPGFEIITDPNDSRHMEEETSLEENIEISVITRPLRRALAGIADGGLKLVGYSFTFVDSDKGLYTLSLYAKGFVAEDYEEEHYLEPLIGDL